MLDDHLSAEEDLLNIFELSMDLLCVIRKDGFKLLNPAWNKILKWELEEIKTKPWMNLVHHSDREEALSVAAKLRINTEPVEFTCRMLAKDGSSVWIEWNLMINRKTGDIFADGRDITEHIRMKTHVETSEKNYREIFDSAGDMILVHDEKGIMLDVNNVASDRLGYTKYELMKMPLNALDSPADAEQIPLRIKEIMDKGHAEFEVEHRKKDGTRIPTWIMARKILFNGQRAVLTIARDITRRRKMENDLQKLAVTDSLTGIANHRAFMEKVNNEFIRFKRYGSPLSVAILDVDYFKSVNDRYGHDVGDEVLKKLVSEVSHEIRDIDFFGRLGGEEFGLLFVSTNNVCAEVSAERIRSCIENSYIQTESGILRITVSIGLSAVHKKDEKIQEIMKRADQALYDAKEQGRNRIHFR